MTILIWYVYRYTNIISIYEYNLYCHSETIWCTGYSRGYAKRGVYVQIPEEISFFEYSLHQIDNICA